MLTFTIKALKKYSGLYNTLYTSSYTNKKNMYANLRQRKIMGKSKLLKNKLK